MICLHLQLLRYCSRLFGAKDYQMNKETLLSTGLPSSYPFSQADIYVKSEKDLTAINSNYYSENIRVPVKRSTSKGESYLKLNLEYFI